jgi:hypothetical protein
MQKNVQPLPERSASRAHKRKDVCFFLVGCWSVCSIQPDGINNAWKQHIHRVFPSWIITNGTRRITNNECCFVVPKKKWLNKYVFCLYLCTFNLKQLRSMLRIIMQLLASARHHPPL